jgi:hypothetical protein
MPSAPAAPACAPPAPEAPLPGPRPAGSRPVGRRSWTAAPVRRATLAAKGKRTRNDGNARTGATLNGGAAAADLGRRAPRHPIVLSPPVPPLPSPDVPAVPTRDSSAPPPAPASAPAAAPAARYAHVVARRMGSRRQPAIFGEWTGKSSQRISLINYFNVWTKTPPELAATF